MIGAESTLFHTAIGPTYPLIELFVLLLLP
jgi:hypothetical protein